MAAEAPASQAPPPASPENTVSPPQESRSTDVVGSDGQPPRSKATTIDARSLVFDPAWYLTRYLDVANAQLDPVQHYLDNGCAEGRDPNPFFSTRFYCDNNPDVVASGMNPFLHYVLYGAREGRAPRA